MNLSNIILTAIFGPEDTRTVEEAEADYKAAKEAYDTCHVRKDKRGEGQAWPILNRALNQMLAAECGQHRRVGL